MKPVKVQLDKIGFYKLKGRHTTKEDKLWMNALADLGCIVCKNEGHGFSPAAIHHIDGKTKEGAHLKTIPLCGQHHQMGGYGIALHAGRKKWESLYGTQQELLIQVQNLIA